MNCSFIQALIFIGEIGTRDSLVQWGRFSHGGLTITTFTSFIVPSMISTQEESRLGNLMGYVVYHERRIFDYHASGRLTRVMPPGARPKSRIQIHRSTRTTLSRSYQEIQNLTPSRCPRTFRTSFAQVMRRRMPKEGGSPLSCQI